MLAASSLYLNRVSVHCKFIQDDAYNDCTLMKRYLILAKRVPKLLHAANSLGLIIWDLRVPLLLTLVPRYLLQLTTLTDQVLGAEGVKKLAGLGLKPGGSPRQHNTGQAHEAAWAGALVGFVL